MALDQVKSASNFGDRDLGDDIGRLLFEPDPDWSFVVKGDRLWDSDPENFTSPCEPRPEIEELRAAVASRDPAAVRRVYTSQWLEKPEAERIDRDLFASSLDEAIQQDDVSSASYLLSNGMSIDMSHFTMAVEMKKYSFLQLYLDKGWDINAPIERTKPPPLSLALNDANLTSWFLAHGADPNAQCGLDLTPLSVAVSEAPFAIIKLLFDHGGSTRYGQLLHYAVRRNHSDRLEVLKFIISKGPPINKVMYQDRLDCYDQFKYFGIGTPLHEAAEDGKIDIVELLLAEGADPLIKDAKGELAIERARRAGRSAVVKQLLPLSDAFS
ncbi:MAG: hypothetical protein Q9217_006618 [Psora testacea]